MKYPVKAGVRDLIIFYFKVDVLDKEPLAEDTRQNIIETFTYCWAHHMSIQAIVKELRNSNLSELRERIIKRMESNYNPYPLRLGDLKPRLQMEAMDNNKSLHNYILTLLREREKKQKAYIDLYCVPRLNRIYRLKKPIGNEVFVQLSFWS